MCIYENFYVKSRKRRGVGEVVPKWNYVCFSGIYEPPDRSVMFYANSKPSSWVVCIPVL